MQKRALIIGVMGGAASDPSAFENARRLGGLIARQGWILLNGGRDTGVMAASAQGARENGGLTVGILPDDDCRQVSAHIQVPIRTGMGSGRNIVNVLSSDLVVACPGGAGTLSEVALALKHGKHVVAMGYDPGRALAAYKDTKRLLLADSPEAVMAHLVRLARLIHADTL